MGTRPYGERDLYHSGRFQASYYTGDTTADYYAGETTAGHYAEDITAGHYAGETTAGHYGGDVSADYYAGQAPADYYAEQAPAGYYAEEATDGHHAEQAPAEDYLRRPEVNYSRGPNWPEIEGRRSRAMASVRISLMLAAALALLLGGIFVFTKVKHHPALAGSNVTVPPLGSSVSGSANLAEKTSQFGHMAAVRVYYPGLPGTNAWTTGVPAQANSTVVVSFKALPQTILSGADDAALAHFFNTAPRGKPIYYSYYHEPEDNIQAGQFTAADYRAAWARVVSIANAAHNPDLHSTLILMEWDLQAASGRNWKNYLPGGGIISTLGWDAYPVGTVSDNNPQLTQPADFLGPAVAASKSVGLPFGFAEFALGTAVGRPGWLTEVGNYIMQSGAVFGTLFDSSTFPTMQLTDSASISAWRSMVTESTDGNTTPISTPAPVSTPTGVPTTAPAPAPSASATPTATATAPPPAPTGSAITALTVNPPSFVASGQNHTVITVTLAHPADVTVCVLDHQGKMVRQISRPDRAAGQVRVPYYGYNGSGHRLPAGQYQILVVASNAQGSSTAEAPLTITAP